MKIRVPLLTAWFIALGLLTTPLTLHAQLPKIFVASTGNDANDGSRGAPKRNFQAAHSAVADGGQIIVLDTAGYGALVINKSVSVTVPPGVNGFVTVGAGNSGITINAGLIGVVALRGLIVEGGGANSNGNGIYATGVGTLTIEDCTVRNFKYGIFAAPANAAQVSIYNTAARSCSYGLIIQPGAAVTVTASATGCRVENCNNDGVVSFTDVAGSAVDFTVDGCTVRGNNVGLLGSGTNALLRASNCTITGNSNGTLFVNGGQILSRGNNTLEKNTSGNTFPGTYSAK